MEVFNQEDLLRAWKETKTLVVLKLVINSSPEETQIISQY